ncbi:zinc finger C3H1 domain-containing protein isoform X3 [Hoplias malabaricus]|uniref:zinc finger C3H1 domain-containing protein isoform X3 n=1 Tax=Hoplias malabaricus TaxID=27720 RepID=UPI00346344E3
MAAGSGNGSPREEGELEDGEICDDEPQEAAERRPQIRPSSARCRPGLRGVAPGPGPGLGGEPSPRSNFWERSHGALGRFRYRGRGRGNRGGNRPQMGRYNPAEYVQHSRRDSPNRKKQGVRVMVRKAVHSFSKAENGVDESFEDLLMKYKQIQLELESIRDEEKRALKSSEASPHQAEEEEVEKAAGAQTLAPAGTEGPQIQLEVTTEEAGISEREERKVFQAFNIRPLRQKLLSPAERDALKTKTTNESESKDPEKTEKNADEPSTLNDAEEDEEGSESDLNASLISKESEGTPVKVKGKGKDEDDELSELQLRLLALQSASRRWQQKEQQVMKESKEKLTRNKTGPDRTSIASERPRVTTRFSSAGRGRTGPGLRSQDRGKPAAKGHSAKKTVSPGPAAKQAWRKQQLRNWKLQRQQEEQRQKYEEEEERRKREDEIRRIRDLSNQDEQYNRFMKLVGGKQHRTRSKSADTDHRKPGLKQGVDVSGNLYQYDNYDEVAMETDSEPNSPAASPPHDPFGVGPMFLVPAMAFPSDSSPVTQEVSQYFADTLSIHLAPPPPPPPMPPPDEAERPPKPPFADEEEEEEMMLREELLKSLANKRSVRPEDTSSNSGPPSPAARSLAPPTAKSSATSISITSQTRPNKFTRGPQAHRVPLVLPRHKAVVVRLNDSDDSDSEGEASSSVPSVFGGLESMIKEARRTVEAAKPRSVPASEKENNPLRTPESMPEAKKVEHRVLREEFGSREKQLVVRSDPTPYTAVGSEVDAAGLQLSEAEEKFSKHCAQLEKDRALLEHLRQQELRKKESLKAAEAKVYRLKEQLLASERVVSANRLLLKKLQEQVHRVQHRVALKQHQALRLEKEMLLAQAGATRVNYKHNPNNNTVSQLSVIQVDFDPMAVQQTRTEMKPVSFGPYRSPLLLFKSYRFSPYFRTKEKLSLSSITYSNVIEPRKCFCRFDLTGTCNDDDCQWQHMRNCTLNGNQLFQDILSYSLPLIGCSDDSSTGEISQATEKYIKKLFGANKDRMGTDQKAVLLVSKVNESLRHVPPFTTCKEKRKWRPEPQRVQHEPGESEEENSVTVPAPTHTDGRILECWSVWDVCVTQDDKRYFDSETDDISNLEYSVLESPRDVQLWIKLAYKYLSQKDTSTSECLDAALNTLSRALEDNREDVEVWCHYLSLFCRRGSKDEVQEMCEMAVEHAPHYQVWWTYLNTESTFEGKDSVCNSMIQFLLEPSGGDREDERSFWLLETLLYRTQLSVFTGRVHNARAILQKALVSVEDRSVSGALTLSHRSVAWLCYIHLCEFGFLPSCLYDPTSSNPSRIVSLEPFLLPWSSENPPNTPPDHLIGLFHDAVSRCVDDQVSPAEQMQSCLSLHTNLVHLLRLLGRHQEAVGVCERVLSECPQCCPLLEMLCELHLAMGAVKETDSVWLRAHSLCPNNAEIFYHLYKHLYTQEKLSEAEALFEKFVLSFCDSVPADVPPIALLRHLLSLPMQIFQRAPPTVRPELQQQLQEQLPYLSLLHSVWQTAQGSVGEAVEAFEAALGSVNKLEVLQKLWLDYLLFAGSKVAGVQPGVRELRMFTDLLHRCLATVPSRFTLPYNSATYWSSYKFHNQVVSLFLRSLPVSLHTSVLERLRHLMPTNIELALRLLQQEWSDGNVEHVKLQTKMLSSSAPYCLASWKIAIAVQKEQKGRVEVQRLYQQALQKLPLCAALWKDWLLFEAAGGAKADSLKKLVSKCQDVGVSLNEPLRLGPASSDAQVDP